MNSFLYIIAFFTTARAQITSISISSPGGYGTCDSGCCSPNGPCCGGTTNLFTQSVYSQSGVPPNYFIGSLVVTSKTGKIDSFAWLNGAPTNINVDSSWVCGGTTGKICTPNFGQLEIASASTDDRSTSLKCGILISGTCTVTLCVKVCVDLPKWPAASTLQITPSWTPPSACISGVDACFQQYTVDCSTLISDAKSAGLSSSNDFTNAINPSAQYCNVGWYQRNGNLVPPNLAQQTWTNPSDTQYVGLIIGSNISFRLSVPLKVGTSTWFDMDVGGDFFNVQILAIEDPGMPLNMTLSPDPGAAGACGFSCARTGQFTPIPGQQGQTLQAHFVAMSQCCAGAECLAPSFSNIVSMFLPVTGPVSEWQNPDTVDLPRSQALTVGQTWSASLQCITFQGVPAITIASASFNGAQPPDDMGLDTAGFAASAAAVTCTAGSLDNPLRCVATAEVSVTARPGDEGSVKEWCFACGDASGVSSGGAECFNVTTNLCEYMVQPGDTLRAISRRSPLSLPLPTAHCRDLCRAAAARGRRESRGGRAASGDTGPHRIRPPRRRRRRAA